MNYESVIGLEMHAELSTKTKVYCACSTEFGGEVNTRCCPVCTGMPGALPVLNGEVVHYAIKMGVATDCDINRLSKQDRKHYFYPDLPKAYQISQFDIPICEKGEVVYYDDGVKKTCKITRIHIEEDAGKLLHDDKFGGSLVDLNRCGVPLIEIVSEPDLRTANEAKAYLEALKGILESLNISHCKMQEGNIRCDVNVSIRPVGQEKFGTRVEMKNINTFSGAQRAINYEVERQKKILADGGEIFQETRRWDDLKGESFPMREKNDAHDYRYFPEPDLVTIEVTDEMLERAKGEIPELPLSKYERYFESYKLTAYESELLAFDLQRAEFIDACHAINPKLIKQACNYLLGEISRVANERGCTVKEVGISADKLMALLVLVDDKTISNSAAKTVFTELLSRDVMPMDIVKEKGLMQISDSSALLAIVEEVLSENAKSIDDYRGGKTNVLGFLVGLCMKKSKGSGNPKIFNELLLERLKG